MTTAVIGVGTVAGVVARHLVRRGEPVALAANAPRVTAAEAPA